MPGSEKETGHVLDFGHVDEIDERDGDELLVLIWCSTHGGFEWHWVDEEDLK